MVLNHVPDTEEHAQGLGDYRGQGRAESAPLKNRHKEKVKNYVGDTRGGYKIKGLFGIPHAPEYGAQGIVTKDKDDPRKGYGKVALAFTKRLKGGLDKAQYRLP